MKTDAITKSYSALTNKQRAALFFRYTTQEDELETMRVLSSVPKKTYTMNDVEFIKWVDGFSALASAFAHQHWFARHGLVESALRLKSLVSKNPERLELWEAALDDVQYWQQNLLSLDAALSAVAKQHGFDLLSVYQRAQTKPYRTNVGEITADDEMVAIWTQNFSLMAESSFG